jgi:hemerythrin-like domain-containing protein
MLLDAVLAQHRKVTRSRLDHTLGSLEHRDWETAATSFDQFRRACEEHMDVEEREMFPALDAQLGERSPAAGLRAEHVRFRQMCAYIAACIDLRDAEAAAFALNRFGDQFEAHDLREEWVLFPMCERLLPPERLAALRAALAEAEETH